MSCHFLASNDPIQSADVLRYGWWAITRTCRLIGAIWTRWASRVWRRTARQSFWTNRPRTRRDTSRMWDSSPGEMLWSRQSTFPTSRSAGLFPLDNGYSHAGVSGSRIKSEVCEGARRDKFFIVPGSGIAKVADASIRCPYFYVAWIAYVCRVYDHVGLLSRKWRGSYGQGREGLVREWNML